MANDGSGVFQLAQELTIDDRHVQGLCAADFNNDADQAAEPPEGGPVTDSDTADVEVIGPAIECMNGLIYVIDRVLLPPVPTPPQATPPTTE